jgi:hypothetical protein
MVRIVAVIVVVVNARFGYEGAEDDADPTAATFLVVGDTAVPVPEAAAAAVVVVVVVVVVMGVILLVDVAMGRTEGREDSWRARSMDALIVRLCSLEIKRSSTVT